MEVDPKEYEKDINELNDNMESAISSFEDKVDDLNPIKAYKMSRRFGGRMIQEQVVEMMKIFDKHADEDDKQDMIDALRSNFDWIDSESV